MEVQLFKPYDKQIEVIEAVENTSLFYVICIVGRQSGKTVMAQNLAIKYCLEHNERRVMWISPTDNQAQKVFKEIINKFPKQSGLVKSKKGAKGDTEIVWKTGSTLLFRSAGSEDTLRGDKNHFIILDEAAKIKESTVDEIIKPTQNAVKEPKMLIISTPKGKNWLYDYYQKGLNSFEHPKYKSFHFTCYDSPYTNKELIEQERIDLTELRFRQEILAEFVDGASVFKNVRDCSIQPELTAPETDDRYYAGVDVGLLTDATVLTILNGAGNLVKYFKWERKDSADIIKDIEEINRVWKFKRILFETNNHGLPMYQELKKKLNNIQDINTSSKSKPRMIERLIYLFENRLIRIVNDSALREELDAFNYKVSETGYVKYGAAQGEHDDIVMSLAIARECWEGGRYNSRYVGFF